MNRLDLVIDLPDKFNREICDRYAFAYTGTELGNHSDIHLLFTVDDARRWCSSPMSRGQSHGTRWAYFWTTCSNLFDCLGASLDLDTIVDNGEWDEKIRAAGAMKIPLTDWPGIFVPAGVEVSGRMVHKPAPAPVAAIPEPDQLDLGVAA